MNYRKKNYALGRKVMSKINNLQEVFTQIVEMVGREPANTFYKTWHKIMSRDMGVPFNIALKAWEQIQVEYKTWDYFELKIWSDKVDYLMERLEVNKKDDTKKPIQEIPDDVKKSWTENYHKFTDGLITRLQYLNNAVKLKQMTKAEAEKEKERYKKPGRSWNNDSPVKAYPLNETIIATIKGRF